MGQTFLIIVSIKVHNKSLPKGCEVARILRIFRDVAKRSRFTTIRLRERSSVIILFYSKPTAEALSPLEWEGAVAQDQNDFSNFFLH